MPVFLFHHVIRGGFHIQLHEHGVHDDLLMPTRFSRESTAGDAVSPVFSTERADAGGDTSS
jgi:hypothetical protein